MLTSERRGQVADHICRAVVSACGLHAVHSTLRGVQLLTARVVSATPGTHPTANYHYSLLYSPPLATLLHHYSLPTTLLLTTHYYSLLLTPTHSTTRLTHSPQNILLEDEDFQHLGRFYEMIFQKYGVLLPRPLPTDTTPHCKTGHPWIRCLYVNTRSSFVGFTPHFKCKGEPLAEIAIGTSS